MATSRLLSSVGLTTGLSVALLKSFGVVVYGNVAADEPLCEVLDMPSQTRSEAENFYNYLRTSFVRFLILQSLSFINLSRDAYVLVPKQDFSHPWTDEMLYKKYKLTEDEIAFIESMIRPME